MRNWFASSGRMVSAIATAAALTAGLWSTPSLADPFRDSNPRAIGSRTEAAFKAVFERGDYKTADQYLKQAEPGEPLAYALKASLAYTNWQGESDPQKQQQLSDLFAAYANQTRAAANQLMKTDALRGNLYSAVGLSLEAAYVLGREGTVRGTPEALGKLQEAFKYMDKAQAIAPADPELNLIKGYMDLMLSLNLPFSNPGQAIDRLEKYAGPRYLADRGVAIGYRESQPTRALEAVNRALQVTPDNPELLYLKAQILVRQGNNKDSIPLFEKALTKKDQLPAGLIKQMNRELSGAKRRFANSGR